MEDTPTVRHVQGGIVMLEIGYGLSKTVMFRGGGVYGSSDTTEDGGFLLVNS